MSKTAIYKILEICCCFPSFNGLTRTFQLRNGRCGNFNCVYLRAIILEMRTSKNSRQSGSQPPGRDLETTLPGLRTLWSLKMYQKLQKNIVLHNKKTWKIIWYWDYWPQNKYLPEHRTLGNNVPGLEPEKVENHCSWDYKRHKLSENDSVSFTLHSFTFCFANDFSMKLDSNWRTCTGCSFVTFLFLPWSMN